MLADANQSPPPTVHAYIIEVHKYPCGRIDFRVVVSDGGKTLVPWTTLPSALGDPFVDRDVRGMSGGPSTGDTPGRTLRRVVAASDARPWEEESTDPVNGLGLQIRRPVLNHVQFMKDGAVFAEWWPSSGTTRMDGRRGPHCAAGEDVVAWLKRV
jgi:hypothetical protein